MKEFSAIRFPCDDGNSYVVRVWPLLSETEADDIEFIAKSGVESPACIVYVPLKVLPDTWFNITEAPEFIWTVIVEPDWRVTPKLATIFIDWPEVYVPLDEGVVKDTKFGSWEGMVVVSNTTILPAGLAPPVI